MAYERYILDTVQGRSEDEAADLPEILEAIDARDKWVPTLEELSAALRKLIEDGSITELPGHRYVDAAFGSGSSTFQSQRRRWPHPLSRTTATSGLGSGSCGAKGWRPTSRCGRRSRRHSSFRMFAGRPTQS